MRIIVIGAGGGLGKAVSVELSVRHEIVGVGRTSGDFHADMREITSLRTVFQKVGKADAIVCTAGSVHFGPWAELTPEKFDIGLRDKLMGQVNVVLAGQEFLNDGGSFTLTSGILSEDPILSGRRLRSSMAHLKALFEVRPSNWHAGCG
jgi:nucleoside-diphosphate-sugar epimerase